MLPDTADFSDVEQLAAETGFTRFPVFHESQRNIIGIVSLRQGLAELSENAIPRSVASLLERKVLFVPQSKTLGSLLGDFRVSRQPMAVVTDEEGKNAVGVVTDEMLLEVLTDGIRELRDPGRPMVRKLSNARYVCDATVRIQEVEKLLGLRMATPGVDSLGVLCHQLFGKNPRRNRVGKVPNCSRPPLPKRFRPIPSP